MSRHSTPASATTRRTFRSDSARTVAATERSLRSGEVDRSAELRRVTDEQRREITALRQQVEGEKQRVRDVQREKNLALRQAKEQFEKEREHLVEVTARRAASDKELELKAHYEAQLRAREQELRQVVRLRDDELRKQRQQLTRERDEMVRVSREDAERRVKEQLDEQHGAERARMMAELWAMREQKVKAEEQLEIRVASEQEKVQQMRTMRAEHDQEMKSLVRKSKIESERDAQQLRLAERMMHEKDLQLEKKDYNARILSMEKDTLSDQVSLLKSAESWEKRSPLGKGRPSEGQTPGADIGASPTLTRKRVSCSN